MLWDYGRHEYLVRGLERCANLDPKARGLTDPQYVMVAAMAAIRTTSNGLAVSDLRKADPLRLNIIGQLAVAVGEYRASKATYVLDDLLLYISTVELPKTEQPFTPPNSLLSEPELSLVCEELAQFGGISECWPIVEKPDQTRRVLAATSGDAAMCYLLLLSIAQGDPQLRYLHVLLANPVLTQVFGTLLIKIGEFRGLQRARHQTPTRLNPIDQWILATRHIQIDAIPDPEATEAIETASTTTVEDL